MKKTANNNTKGIAKVECTECHQMVYAYRTKSGRIFVGSTSALVLGAGGAVVGGSFGIASGGWGAPATYYLASGLAAIGGGYGFIAGNAMDKPHCPNCEETIEVGL